MVDIPFNHGSEQCEPVGMSMTKCYHIRLYDPQYMHSSQKDSQENVGPIYHHVCSMDTLTHCIYTQGSMISIHLYSIYL